jgi:hypothetical protein
MKNEQIFKEGKYIFTLYEREGKSNYPNHNFAVKKHLETPKAKWAQTKQLNHYVFKTFGDAMEYVLKETENIKHNNQRREEEKQKTRRANAEVSAADFYKVGDIIVNTWGYEQTNVDFYKVTAVKNKTIYIIEIAHESEKGSEYSHGMACNVLPAPDSEGEKTYNLRVKAEGRLSNPESYYYFRKWDGRPEYKSWYY